MITALETQPLLRPDVKIVRREHDGQVHYVVKVPDAQKYFRFGESEVSLMRLMDGSRRPADIAAELAKTQRLEIGPGQVADFAHKLKRLGIVKRTPAEQRLILLEHVRANRDARARRRTKGSVLRLQFKIGDPDAAFSWIVARTRWAWTSNFVALSLALFAVYTFILVAQWEKFWAGTVGLYTFTGFGLTDWLMLYGLFLVIGAVHELGHGLTTKAFGGEVRDWGAMLFYFSPALYCNTSDAWTFERRSHRLWVNFAGPWIQLILVTFAAIVWITTEPATFIHRLAFLSILSGGILAVLANLNPLLALDGYYALSDYLEIPNLRRRSFEYLEWAFKHFVLGMPTAEPRVTPRERRVFLTYGIAATAYSLFIIIVSLLWLIFVIGRFIGPWVWIIVAIVALKLTGRGLARWRAVNRAAASNWRVSLGKGRRRTIVVVGVLLVLVLPFIIPWTFRARGEFTVEAAPRADVRTYVGGVIDRWHVVDSEQVRAGDPLATIWNSELLTSLTALQARADRLAVRRASAETRGDLSGAASLRATLREIEAELDLVRGRRDHLVIRAPIDGFVIGGRLSERLGSRLAEGDLLLQLAGGEARIARIRIPNRHAGDIRSGQGSGLKLSARPDLEFRAPLVSVAPSAHAGWLEAVAVLPNAGWMPAPGMTGVAKIETRHGTLAQAIGRAVRQTIKIDLWL